MFLCPFEPLIYEIQTFLKIWDPPARFSKFRICNWDFFDFGAYPPPPLGQVPKFSRFHILMASLTILVNFSEKSTNLVCSYCWECNSWQFHQILQELSFSNREFYRSCHIQFRFVDFSPSTIFVTQFLSLLPRIVILSLSNEKSTILVIDKSCRLF